MKRGRAQKNAAKDIIPPRLHLARSAEGATVLPDRRQILFTLLIFALSITHEGTASDSAKDMTLCRNRYEVTVASIRKAQEWPALPSSLAKYTIKAGKGKELLIVKFKIFDTTTRQEDPHESFQDFQLQDTSGNTYPSETKANDLREAPFIVPRGTRPKTFRFCGLTFDLRPYSTESPNQH